MTNHTEPIHHYHTKKRVYQKLEKYPHTDKWKRFLDKSIYFIGAVGPIMTLPQLMKIWVEKNASGVSAISWIAYLITAIFWLSYGIVHKEKPIIFTYSVWIVFDIFVVIGTIMYG